MPISLDLLTSVTSIADSDLMHIRSNAGTDYKILGSDVLRNLNHDLAANSLGIGTLTPSADIHILNSSVLADLMIESSAVGGNSRLLLNNTVQEWTVLLHGSTSNLSFYDATGTTYVMSIEPGAPAESLYIQSDGHVGFGRVPITDFDFYRASENATLFVETGLASGISGVIVVADSQQWIMQCNGAANDVFSIGDNSSATTPFKIEKTAPNNSIYIDNTGNIGLGRETNAYKGELYDATGDCYFNIETDKVNGYAVLRLTNDARSWDIRINGAISDNLEIRDVANSATSVTIEPSVHANRLYLDSSGAVLINSGTPLHSRQGTIEVASAWALIGHNTITNLQPKESRIGVSHYTNAEEPVTAIFSDSTVGVNTIRIGGGTGSGNAATVVSFFTGVTTTTLTGTERMRINSSGLVLINRTSGDGTPAFLQVNGNLSIRGTSDADRHIYFASDAELLWDESFDEFIFNKHVFSEVVRTVDAAAVSQNTLFDALKDYIPVVGDRIAVNGSIASSSTTFYTCTYAERDTTTRIFIYCMVTFNGTSWARGAVLVDDGVGTQFSAVSISW